jgi:hypothetical protein
MIIYVILADFVKMNVVSVSYSFPRELMWGSNIYWVAGCGAVARFFTD